MKPIRLKTKPKVFALWIILGILLGALAAAYLVVPGQVAKGIIAKNAKPTLPTGKPSDHGMAYSSVLFQTEDGYTLVGWWVPSKLRKSKGTVILAHGIFKNRDQMMGRARFLHNAGYGVFLIDLRGHGESCQAPLSGGLNEAKDLRAALAYLRSKRLAVEPTALFGLSLGGMAALRAAVDEPKVAVIVDCPLPDGRSYVGRRTLGRYFLFLPGFFGRCLASYNRSTELSLTVQDLDLGPVADRLKNRQVLLFAGDQDDMARPDSIRDLFGRIPSHGKHILMVSGAGHDKTYETLGGLYEKQVLGFLGGLGK